MGVPLIIAAVAVSFGAFASAFLGGLLAVRAVRAVGLVIALGAGVRIGAAYFELVPEAVNHLGGSLDAAMVFTAIGFLAFYAVEKLTTVHVGHETAAELDHDTVAHRHVGVIGASGMSIHSLLDGVALAAGLAIGGELGVVLAVVVIVHRFSDGIGIVSMLLATQHGQAEVFRWVSLVAVAPVIGVVIGLVIPVPDPALGAMLGTFAGFFLYVGAAELLPEAHRSDRSRRIVVATLVGVAAIWGVSWIAAAGAVG